ncbi:hypothetical protein TBR22_A49420 [Luteitalea sp. TBR-22]|uniref:vWA domain-containing protein n=1 Tax=Luteitalea sp. TBR-22 TaxID=2802971 RepID=UPI001AF16040|nr:vWA domain-containing protein [Luteitalea sp. TBR-22]BCS35708.1 hypothetical protein TBR22_A49420 [Luteitalea sp. TBR-22]
MRQLLTLVLAAALASSVLAPAAQAQSDPRQRTLLVTAIGPDGLPVETLDAEDVVVREDGVAREVLKVTRSTAPMDITILVDNSLASTRALQDIRLGLEQFVTNYAGPHPITIMTVADRPTVQVASTTGKPQLVSAVKRLFAQPDSGAMMIEGIVDASRAIQKRKPARATIIAITSFGTEFSDRGFQFALDALAESGATLHVLELQDTQRADPTSQNMRDRNVVIDRGTTETGGARELIIANMNLTDALQKVGRIALTQHEVLYGRPDRLVPAKEVEVFSARPTLKIRANTLQANRVRR